MKRHGGIFERICDIENLRKAHRMARKDKTYYAQVKMIDENEDYYLHKIREMLINKTFTTSEYKISTINDRGKERQIYKLPYFVDRVVHWAIMLQIEDIFVKSFIRNTFGSIKGRGVHDGLTRIKRDIKNDREGTKYCLKIDVRKFFPSIDQAILKKLYRRKFKDKDLLWLLDDITDSIEGGKGIAIGNYISQYTSNFYLSYFDHWLKEDKRIKYLYRYVDDVVILHHDKEYLHGLKREIDEYLRAELKLEINDSWQVFPVAIRGIDFLGYRIFPDYTLLRKSTKTNMIGKLSRIEQKGYINYSEFCTINSYKGWLIGWCDSYRLLQKYFKPLKHLEENFRSEVKNIDCRIRMEPS